MRPRKGMALGLSKLEEECTRDVYVGGPMRRNEDVTGW